MSNGFIKNAPEWREVQFQHCHLKLLSKKAAIAKIKNCQQPVARYFRKVCESHKKSVADKSLFSR